jgi:hypothetical protein
MNEAAPIDHFPYASMLRNHKVRLTPKLSGVPLAARPLKRRVGRRDKETRERDLRHSAK